VVADRPSTLSARSGGATHKLMRSFAIMELL
jgi:hypothetical protein